MILSEKRSAFRIVHRLTSLAGALNYPLGHLPIGLA